MTTKQQIVELLKTNDKAIARALVVLNARQTDSEQAKHETRYLNGEGFRPCHARMGTSMAHFFETRGFLSPKQVAYWRVKDRTGKMRIEIYAGQLLVIAQQKEVTKGKSNDDLGNVSEELMVLSEMLVNEEYEYNMYLDSDDEPKLRKMAASIASVRSRIESLKAIITRAYKEM